MQETSTQSVLTLEGQKKLTMTGVESVDAFSEQTIRLTVAGKKVTIGGNHLKVTSFSQEKGDFSASGEVDDVRFGKGGAGKFFK